MEVRDQAAWTATVSETMLQHLRIDALVNDAAIVEAAPMEELTLASFERMLEINVVGTWLGLLAVTPIMQELGAGSIVNISSTSGLHGDANMTIYDASKWAFGACRKRRPWNWRRTKSG